MAALVKIRGLLAPLTSKQSCVIYNVNRAYANTDAPYRPGPYPTTKEQRIAAAKKYGLHPAEYQPYPDDGMYPVGDYPKLPFIGRGLNDPNYPYDFPDERRNFGETLHVHHDIMGEDRCDYGEKPPVGYRTATLVFWGIFFGLFGVYHLVEPYPNFPKVMEKQMYRPGVKHYTFEPAK